MTDKEKIKAEIERAITLRVVQKDRGELSTYGEGVLYAFKNMLRFIDCLPEEPVNKDLEVAAEEARKRIRPLFESIKESTGEPVSTYDQHDMIEMFKAGARWQKQKMTKEALDSVIVDEGLYKSIAPTMQAMMKCSIGDKVKVIIIKDE